jgi:hypothetical protein
MSHDWKYNHGSVWTCLKCQESVIHVIDASLRADPDPDITLYTYIGNEIEDFSCDDFVIALIMES